MTTEDYNFYKLLIEAIIAIASLLIGGGIGIAIENKWKISKRFMSRIKQAGTANQAAQIVDSPGASIVLSNSEPRVGSAAEALGSQPTFPTSTPVSLNVNQSHIFQKVQEALQKLNMNSTFQARYQSAVGHLNNNNAQICSSEYHAAFLDVVPTLLERTTYGANAPTDDNLTTLRGTFGEIRNFMNSASNDDSALRTAIRNFENALIVILGYL